MSLKNLTINRIIKYVSIIGVFFSFIYIFYLWSNGILTSQDNMTEYISGLGIWGPFVFIIIQIIQVVIPIIPGGISCVMGVIMFGAVKGFIYNYIGIIVGSVIAFLITKKYGMTCISKLFGEKKISKYKAWTDNDNRFTKLFAFAMFFPFSPDDFLCYLAGTTNMSLKTFIAIITVFKPFSIVVYSMGIKVFFEKLLLIIR